MAETKIIYHIDEEETPYLVKLPVPPEKVTLADFKNVLSNRPVHSYKFFFKSMDQDFGVVKEEISDDNAKLPCFNGRVVSWLVLAESSHSDTGSQCTESHTDLPPPLERTGGIGDSRPPSFHPNAASSRDGLDNETGTESVISHRRERHRRRNREGHEDGESCPIIPLFHIERTVLLVIFQSSNYFCMSAAELCLHSCCYQVIFKPDVAWCYLFTINYFVCFSTPSPPLSVCIEKYNFLGISIVGQSNDRGDGGIYIGSIMKGGAVAADGRIEPGDMLLQVNDVNFENMSNDDAVRVLREIVSKPGPISLTVAKCWDPTPRSYFTIPRAEPVRPIDPAAWISHTTAMTGAYPRYGMSPSMSITTSTSSSLTSSIPDSEKLEESPLTVKSDMATIVKVMQLPDSGLEIRDRMWLKITISNAVIGADVVDWLYTHVEGFKDRREARKYASSMLKHGYLRHTVNKITFSEQCYYVFGDLCGNMAALNLNNGSSGASDQDTLAPLPHPAAPWPLGQGYPYQYPLPPPCFPPAYQDPGFSYGSGSAGSQQSEGSKSSGSNRSTSETSRRALGRDKDRKSNGSGSESDHTARSGASGVRRERPLSQLSHRSHGSATHRSFFSLPPPNKTAKMLTKLSYFDRLALKAMK
uniref:Dishevelled segment polarity protein 1 n=1 Tax=Amazona collaria TaxID=241587 RepID=A0A8B9FK69_9PSIT